MTHRRPTTFAVSIALVIMLFSGVPGSHAADYQEVDGWLNVVWGDGLDGQNRSMTTISLTDLHGQRSTIEFSDAFLEMTGGLMRFNGSKVKVWLIVDQDREHGEARQAAAIRLLEDSRASGERSVTGHQPWISILCKFSNISSEPRQLSYFDNMFANTAGRLDHYWRECSYDAIDLVGSIAVDWVDLGQPQSHYTPVPGQGCFTGGQTDLYTLFDDCTAAADPFADFSNGGTGGFVGINLMFNGDLDGCAWGGGMFAELDNVSKSWRVTWEPPGGYANAAVIGHEMGHGFGLPHSNNADGDQDPYDNPWDVMSDPYSYAMSDPTYGKIPKHTNVYHKKTLGWIPANQILTVNSAGSWTITIDDLTQATTSNYRMAEIEIPSSNRSYAVEVRDLRGDYDGNLPGNAVIIHEINPSRGEPAWLVDTENPEDGADEGAMWRVGETFEDVANEISVEVVSATPNGFMVTIQYGEWDGIFQDGFETGYLTQWSDHLP